VHIFENLIYCFSYWYLFDKNH